MLWEARGFVSFSTGSTLEPFTSFYSLKQLALIHDFLVSVGWVAWVTRIWWSLLPGTFSKLSALRMRLGITSLPPFTTDHLFLPPNGAWKLCTDCVTGNEYLWLCWFLWNVPSWISPIGFLGCVSLWRKIDVWWWSEPEVPLPSLYLFLPVLLSSVELFMLTELVRTRCSWRCGQTNLLKRK